MSRRLEYKERNSEHHLSHLTTSYCPHDTETPKLCHFVTVLNPTVWCCFTVWNGDIAWTTLTVRPIGGHCFIAVWLQTSCITYKKHQLKCQRFIYKCMHYIQNLALSQII